MTGPVQDSDSSKVTPSSEKAHLQSDIIAKEVKDYTDGIIDKGLFSGSVMVAVGDEIVFQSGHSLDDTVKFDSHTLFNSCSVSKLFTAISIHQLAEKGTIHLDEKIGNLGLKGANFDDVQEVTIRQLLNHTSGIRDIDTDKYEVTDTKNFNYSNRGYQLLAEIIKQKSSHGSFHEHVKKEIIEKAQMNDSLELEAQFNPSFPSFATPKDYTQFERLLTESGEYIPNSLVTPPAGNGCFHVSTDDWLKFSHALADGKLPMDALQSSPIQNPHAPKELQVEYCAGLEREPTADKKGMVYYRNGDSPGAIAAFKIIQYPDQKPITIIVNANIGDNRGNNVANDIRKIIEGREKSSLKFP